MCHIHPIYMHSSIETAPLHKILEQSGSLFMDILQFKDLGKQVSSANAVCEFLCSFGYFTSGYNLKAIGPLLMEILHFEDLGHTSVVSECSLGVNLVIVNFLHVPSGTSPLYKI